MIFKNAIVLTGGIASGKSTIKELFESFFIKVIDADQIAHKVLKKKEKEIIKVFGSKIVNKNGIDRKALGKIVFNNPKLKIKLEEIVSPDIKEDIISAMKIEEVKNKPYIVDIPLFFEKGYYPIEKVILVYTSKEIQINRIMLRDNLSKEEAIKRINSQMSTKEKKEKVHG